MNKNEWWFNADPNLHVDMLKDQCRMLILIQDKHKFQHKWGDPEWMSIGDKIEANIWNIRRVINDKISFNSEFMTHWDPYSDMTLSVVKDPFWNTFDDTYRVFKPQPFAERGIILINPTSESH